MKELLIILGSVCFGYCVGAFMTIHMYKGLSPFSDIPIILMRSDCKRVKDGRPESSFIKKIRRLDRATNFLMVSCQVSGVIAIIGLFALLIFS